MQYLQSRIIDMNIAVYMSPNPDEQVRRMAKRYIQELRCQPDSATAKRVLRKIIKAKGPAYVVIGAYEVMLADEAPRPTPT